MTDKIKQAIADEFKYRASQGRTNYSTEEVIYIVNEVINETDFEENESQEQSHDSQDSPNVDLQIRILKGDLQYLAEKVNKLSSLLEGQNFMANINDKIKVKLTEHGRSILEKEITAFGILKRFDGYKYYSPYNTDDEGYTEFQLWNFMRIFGPYFWNGCPQIIEHNEIIFIPKINQNKESI